MGKFDGVLIASDFDGTFANSKGETVNRNIEKIKYFMGEGGYFTISTGRTFQGFHKYSSEYINTGVLLCNGAMAYDYEKEKIIFNNGMGENVLKICNRVRDEFPQVGIEIYPFNQTFGINMREENHRHFIGQSINYSQLKNAYDIPLPVVKMMIFGEHKYLEKIYSDIISEYDDIDVIHGFDTWLEIIKKGSDKGEGLITLAKCLNVKKENVYAVGDGYNDIDMLVKAHKSFVPENGSEMTLKIADYIVCSNDEGVIADVIEILDGIY